jgi:hypothetical protein
MSEPIDYIGSYNRALMPHFSSSFSLPNMVNCSHRDYKINALVVAIRALALPSSSIGASSFLLSFHHFLVA